MVEKTPFAKEIRGKVCDFLNTNPFFAKGALKFHAFRLEEEAKACHGSPAVEVATVSAAIHAAVLGAQHQL